MDKDKFKKVRTTIGNSISKWLSKEGKWNQLVIDTENKNKLFFIQGKIIEN